MNAELQKLLIGEVSGVDDPANQLPGWLVAKASKFDLGPDEPWDAIAAEARVREFTKAQDAPNAAYAACFLWHDTAKTEDFGSYEFLVRDVSDGSVKIMPQAIKSAASRLSESSLPAGDKESLQGVIAKLANKAGVSDDAKPGAPAPGVSTLEKVKRLLLGDTSEEVEMEKAELQAELGEFKTDLMKSVSEALAAPAVEAQVAEEAAAKAAADEEANKAAIAAAIEAGIEKALEPYNEILEKVLDRLEATEKAAGAKRASLDGQETPGDGAAEASKSKGGDVKDAIAKALKHPASGN